MNAFYIVRYTFSRVFSYAIECVHCSSAALKQQFADKSNALCSTSVSIVPAAL